jgi:hypothetical protein
VRLLPAACQCFNPLRDELLQHGQLTVVAAVRLRSARGSWIWRMQHWPRRQSTSLVVFDASLLHMCASLLWLRGWFNLEREARPEAPSAAAVRERAHACDSAQPKNRPIQVASWLAVRRQTEQSRGGAGRTLAWREALYEGVTQRSQKSSDRLARTRWSLISAYYSLRAPGRLPSRAARATVGTPGSQGCGPGLTWVGAVGRSLGGISSRQ